MFGELFELLVSVTFYFLILVTFLRFLFQLLQVDFHNPVSQFVRKVTDPVLGPLRKVIKPVGKFDGASLLAIIVLKVLQLILMELLSYGYVSSIYQIFAYSVVDLTRMALDFYVLVILGQIILSWLAPYNNNPAITLLYQITEPVMKPARKLVPPIGGLDISPILVLLAIKVVEIILIHPGGGLLPKLFSIIGRLLGLM